MSIKIECKNAISELIQVAKLKKGDILVVGCSTSEVVGSRIGTNSDVDTASEIFDGIKRLKQRKIYYTTNNSVMIFLNNLESVYPTFLFNPFSKIQYLRLMMQL